ncbi:MAG: polymorphic toxin type 28 domain-containing protein, partial [Mycobacterium leprae]
EMAGKAVAYRADGKPYDHCQEVWDAQQGVLNKINQLKNFQNDSRLFEPTRNLIQQRISMYSQMLDESESFFRLGPPPTNPLSPYVPRGVNILE